MSEALIQSFTPQTLLIGGCDQPLTEEGDILAKTLGVSGCDIPLQKSSLMSRGTQEENLKQNVKTVITQTVRSPHEKFLYQTFRYKKLAFISISVLQNFDKIHI